MKGTYDKTNKHKIMLDDGYHGNRNVNSLLLTYVSFLSRSGAHVQEVGQNNDWVQGTRELSGVIYLKVEWKDTGMSLLIVAPR